MSCFLTLGFNSVGESGGAAHQVADEPWLQILSEQEGSFWQEASPPPTFYQKYKAATEIGGKVLEGGGKAGGLGGEGADAADGSSLCFRTYRLVHMPTVL